MEEYQIPQLNLNQTHIDGTGRWCTHWLEFIISFCDNLDQLCRSIDPKFPVYSPNRSPSVIADRNALLNSSSNTTPAHFIGNPYLALAIPSTHRCPCNNANCNNASPQHILDVASELSPRDNIANIYNGGYTYSPVSDNTVKSSDRYFYSANPDYGYQAYFDAWSQSVTHNNQNTPTNAFNAKDFDRYKKLSYDGSTTPTTTTPTYSPAFNCRRRKDDLNIPKATSEFDYLLAMQSQEIPKDSKEDLKCEISGVYWDKRSWIASWYEDGKRYYKSFSAKAHGFYRSKYFAIQIRLGKVGRGPFRNHRESPKKRHAGGAPAPLPSGL